MLRKAETGDVTPAEAGVYIEKTWIPATRLRGHKLRRNDKCCFHNRY